MKVLTSMRSELSSAGGDAFTPHAADCSAAVFCRFTAAFFMAAVAAAEAATAPLPSWSP